MLYKMFSKTLWSPLFSKVWVIVGAILPLLPLCSSPGGILWRPQVRLQGREIRGGRRGGPRHPHRHRQGPGEDAEGRALHPLPQPTVRSSSTGMLGGSQPPALVEGGDPESRTLQETQRTPAGTAGVTSGV